MICPGSMRVLSASCPTPVRVLSPLESALSHSVRVYSTKKEGGLSSSYSAAFRYAPPLYRKRPGQTRTTRTERDRIDAYSESNRLAARLILADIEAFGGADSGLCQWAELFLSRHQPKQEQRSLFETEGA